METKIIKCRFVTYKYLVLALVLLLVLSVQLLSFREWMIAAFTTPARDWFHQVQVNTERGEQEALYISSDQSDCFLLRSAGSRSSSGLGGDDRLDNTVFPAGDADVWQCIEHRAAYRRSWSEYWLAMTANASDQAALCAAHYASKQPMAPGPPRIAFLFLVLGACLRLRHLTPQISSLLTPNLHRQSGNANSENPSSSSKLICNCSWSLVKSCSKP